MEGSALQARVSPQAAFFGSQDQKNYRRISALGFSVAVTVARVRRNAPSGRSRRRVSTAPVHAREVLSFNRSEKPVP